MNIHKNLHQITAVKQLNFYLNLWYQFVLYIILEQKKYQR